MTVRLAVLVSRQRPARNAARQTGAHRWLGWLVALVVALQTTVAWSEVQRVESVGVYGIRQGQQSNLNPRDEAIARARREGVSRVALELIGESGAGLLGDGAAGGGFGGDSTIPPLEGNGAEGRAAEDVRLSRDAPTPDQTAMLESALGEEMLPYTRSYRILEDKGELPALFADQPDVRTEYVVVVEVAVDVDRLSSALERAGLVAARDADDALALGDHGEAVTVELVGLARYEALATVLEALRGQLGATRVRTLEFERERQLLAVEGPFGAAGLSARLERYRNPQLVLEPMGVDSGTGRVRVMARWYPEAESAADAADAPPES